MSYSKLFYLSWHRQDAIQRATVHLDSLYNETNPNHLKLIKALDLFEKTLKTPGFHTVESGTGYHIFSIPKFGLFAVYSRFFEKISSEHWFPIGSYAKSDEKVYDWESVNLGSNFIQECTINEVFAPIQKVGKQYIFLDMPGRNHGSKSRMFSIPYFLKLNIGKEKKK